MVARMTIIGIDNGVTNQGIGILQNGVMRLFQLPTKNVKNYQKEISHVRRINFPALIQILAPYRNSENTIETVAIMERPMVNNKMFHASLSAVRCMEAWIIALELSNIPYKFIDSKEWQSAMLPPEIVDSKRSNLKGKERTAQLKKASRDLAIKNWPYLSIRGDGDGLLIAYYASTLTDVCSDQTPQEEEVHHT